MLRRLSVILGGFAIWLAIFVVSANTARNVKFDNDTWLADDNPYQIARDMLAVEFNQVETTTLLFKAEDLFTADNFVEATRVADDIKQLKHVVDVLTPFEASLIMTDAAGSLVITTYRDALQKGQIVNMAALKRRFMQSDYMGRLLSEDERLAAFIIKHDTAGRLAARKAVMKAVRRLAAQSPLLADAEEAGDGFIKYTLDRVTQSELGQILSIASIGIGLFLFFLFGRIWKTVLVLGIGVTAVTAALAVMVGLGHYLTVIALALPVMVSVIVVADMLHIVRYWDYAVEKAPVETTVRDVLVETFKAGWLPCLTTSVTSAVGFGVFYFSELIPLTNFGIDSFVGVLMGYVIMMGGGFLGLYMATPNALMHRAEKKNISLLDRIADSFLKLNWKLVAQARPIIFAATILLTVISVSALWVNAKFESNLLDVFFHEDSEIYQAFTKLDENLGGSGVVSIVFNSGQEDYFRQHARFTDIVELENRLVKLDRINSIKSYTGPIGEIHTSLIDDGSQYPANDEQLAQELLFAEWSRSAESRDVLADSVNFTFDAKHLLAYTPNLSSTKLDALVEKIDAVIKQVNPQALPPHIFTGYSVFFSRLSGYIVNTQFVTIVLTFCFIFVILIVEFNFRLATAGMIACTLPVLSTMGMIAALDYPFDFATVVIASVTMGLSIDDTIHILHRYQYHLVDEQKNRHLSLRQALFIPGRPIVQSTILFCFGAGVFFSSELVMLQRFAGFTMLGLVLALLGAVLLLPSLLKLNLFNKSAL